MLALSLMFAFFGLLAVGLGWPLWQKRIPPNAFYGFRLPKAINNPPLWYQINQWTGAVMCIIGIGTFIVALVVPLLAPNMNLDLYAGLMGGVIGLPTSLLTVWGMWYVYRWEA